MDRSYICIGGGGGTITGGTNGLSTSGVNVVLGGALTGNTSINGNYTLNINDGAKLNTTCGYQISGVTMFRTAKLLNNIGIGQQTLSSITDGNSNIAIGEQVLYYDGIGRGNVGIGDSVLFTNTDGNDNIGIGYRALYNNNNGISNIGIGYQSLYSNSNGTYNIANGACALYSNTSGNNNIANGHLALFNNNGNNNIANGNSALRQNTTGVNNIANGDCALRNNIGGTNNIANGCQALYSNTSGSDNIANGNQALYSNTNGFGNIANGNQALNKNISGTYNIANSCQALYNNTSGKNNIANGYQALYSNTIGKDNIADGQQALNKNINGINNIANGCQSLYNNTSGNHNIAIGFQTLYCNTIGSNNIAIGCDALRFNTGGSYNIGSGYFALYKNIDGSCNTAIGFQALYNNLSGNRNVAIGYSAGINETGSDKLHIANATNCTLICGDFAGKTVKIDDKLITCRLQVTSGATSGYVLTSDASGNATWQSGGGGTNYWSSGATGLSPAAGEDILLPDGDLLKWSDNSCITSTGGGIAVCGGGVRLITSTESIQLSNANWIRLGACALYLGQSSGIYEVNSVTKLASLYGFNCWCLDLKGGNNNTASAAGSVRLCGGNNSSTGAGGDVCLRAGTSTSGTAGRIKLCSLPAQTIETNVVYIDGSGNLSCGAGGGGGLAWTGSTNNGVGTYSSSGTICSEPNLTFNGSALNVTGTIVATSSMTATNFILSSDERLKMNIDAISLTPIDIEYKQFNLCSEPSELRYGVIAQELQINNPELVRIDDKGMLSVSYIDMLVKEIAILKNKVCELEKRM